MRLHNIFPQLIATLLLCIAIALIWLFALAPAASWKQGAITERSQTIEKISELKQRIQAMSVVKQQLSQKGELGILWRAEQTGAATAMVQSNLSKLASNRGISLRSITPMRERDMLLAKTASFRLEMEAGLDQLTMFLRDLEYHSPALLVDKANLRRLNVVSTTHIQPLVFAQIEISAPMLLNKGETDD